MDGEPPIEGQSEGQETRRVYPPREVQSRLEVSASGLRRLAGIYERSVGPLPRDDRGRVWPEEAVEALEDARAMVRESRAVSIEAALRGQEVGGEAEPYPATRRPSTDEISPGAAILEELRGLREAVNEQNRLLAEQGERLKALEGTTHGAQPTLNQPPVENQSYTSDLQNSRTHTAYATGPTSTTVLVGIQRSKLSYWEYVAIVVVAALSPSVAGLLEGLYLDYIVENQGTMNDRRIVPIHALNIIGPLLGAMTPLVGVWLGLRKSQSIRVFSLCAISVGLLVTVLTFSLDFLTLVRMVTLESLVDIDFLLYFLTFYFVQPTSTFAAGAFLANFFWNRAASGIIRSRLEEIHESEPEESEAAAEQQDRLDQTLRAANVSRNAAVITAVIGAVATIVGAIIQASSSS